MAVPYGLRLGGEGESFANRRRVAVRLTAPVSAIELSDENAARLIDAPWEENISLASALVANELDELRARKHRAEVERRDSWNGNNEAALNAQSLKYAAGSYEDYKPYLLRAIAKNEGTGAFYAFICSSGLYIEHGSLGHSIPPSTKVPLVVFLRQQPHRVFVT